MGRRTGGSPRWDLLWGGSRRRQVFPRVVPSHRRRALFLQEQGQQHNQGQRAATNEQSKHHLCASAPAAPARGHGLGKGAGPRGDVRRLSLNWLSNRCHGNPTGRRRRSRWNYRTGRRTRHGSRRIAGAIVCPCHPGCWDWGSRCYLSRHSGCRGHSRHGRRTLGRDCRRYCSARRSIAWGTGYTSTRWRRDRDSRRGEDAWVSRCRSRGRTWRGRVLRRRSTRRPTNSRRGKQLLGRLPRAFAGLRRLVLFGRWHPRRGTVLATGFRVFGLSHCLRPFLFV